MSLGIGIVKPTKRKDIEGVSTNSLIDLKATLFSAEESAKRARAEGVSVARGKLQIKEVQNKGIEERNRKDQEAMEKKLDPTEALSAKMTHYQDMAFQGYRDDAERFLVDFERKRWDTARMQQEGGNRGAAAPGHLDPLDVVAEGQGGWVQEEQEGVLRALGEGRGKEKERADELKARRLAAAKKRMESKEKR